MYGEAVAEKHHGEGVREDIVCETWREGRKSTPAVKGMV